MGTLTRVFCCLILFGWGAEALGGGAVGVGISGAIALGASYLWREQQRQQRAQRHREAVIADEDLRLEVRERRARP